MKNFINKVFSSIETSSVEGEIKNADKYSKDDAYKDLGIVNTWITNVDSKISYSLTFIGVLMGLFITGSKPIKLDETMSKIYSKGLVGINGKEIIILIMIILFIVISILSVIFLYKALKGNFDIQTYKEDGLITNSNVFWGSISKMKYADFHKNITNINEGELIKEISSQIFINSKICSKKFEYYNKGVNCIVASVIMFFLYKAIGIMT